MERAWADGADSGISGGTSETGVWCMESSGVFYAALGQKQAAKVAQGGGGRVSAVQRGSPCRSCDEFWLGARRSGLGLEDLRSSSVWLSVQLRLHQASEWR
eukprot:scaffold309148_cov35-Tisochrysis_lutea.AAC.1